MVKLNAKSVSLAMALIVAGKFEATEAWAFTADDAKALLGDNDWATYANNFLALDDSAPADTKEHYKYPFVKGGKVYRTGLIAASARTTDEQVPEQVEIANAADELLVALATEAKIEPEVSDAELESVTASVRATHLTTEYKSQIFGTVKDIASDARVFSGIASTPNLDRDQDIIPLEAWNMADVNRSVRQGMPMFFAHSQGDLPIGKITKVWKDVETSAIRFRALMMPEGMYALADQVWRMMKEGFLNSVSIGFLSRDRTYNPDTGGVIFNGLELLEISVVPIPANRDAIITTLAAGKCFDSGPDAKALANFIKATGVTEAEDSPPPLHRKRLERDIEILRLRGIN